MAVWLFVHYLFAFRGGEWLASKEVGFFPPPTCKSTFLASWLLHRTILLLFMNYVLIFLALLYFPLCGYAYLAYLLIGSVSMFDFGIGCVGVRKKGECLGHSDLFVHIERAGRVRLNIKVLPSLSYSLCVS